MNKIVFSEKLKHLRLKKNMSQSQLAKNLGITRQALSKYELGTAEPSLYTIIKIADYFNCSLDSLVFNSIKLDENITKLDLDYFIEELTSIQKTNKLLELKINNLKDSILSLNNSSEKKVHEEYSDELLIDIIKLRDYIEHSDNIKCRKVPHLGTIAAGEPCYASGDILDTFYIPEDKLSPSKEYYILNVKGDSMNKLFANNDLLLIEYTTSISNYDIAIALVGTEDATVKKIEFKNNHITLIPMSNNEIHKPKTYNKNDVKLQGKVIGKLIDFLKPSLND